MRGRIIAFLAASAVFAAFAALFLLWVGARPAAGFKRSVPGMDLPAGASATARSSTPDVKIGEFFEKFADAPAGGDEPAWPCFRGADHDNISKSPARLGVSWGGTGPRIAWSAGLGEGYAAASICNGRAYVIDYIEDKKADALRCFNLADGRELWRRWYVTNVRRNHGMSRTIPAVTEKHVVTIGPLCHVMCVDAGDGRLLWGLDMVKTYGATVPEWYAGQCPLIVDGVAVVAPAGKDVLMAGLDCATGEPVWTAPNTRGWKMSHSSVVPMTLHGRKMFVYCAIGGICGISAEKEDAGKVLWEYPAFNHKVVAPSPLHLGDSRILASAGYGAGASVFKINFEGGAFSAETVRSYLPSEGLASEMHTPILLGEHVYGVMAKDAGQLSSQLVCCHRDDTTKIIWSSGKAERFGLGPYVMADGKIFALKDVGVLAVFEASPDKCSILAQAKILKGPDAWGPVAVSGNRLIFRDTKEMLCVEMAE